MPSKCKYLQTSQINPEMLKTLKSNVFASNINPSKIIIYLKSKIKNKNDNQVRPWTPPAF